MLDCLGEAAGWWAGVRSAEEFGGRLVCRAVRAGEKRKRGEEEGG